MKRWSIPVLLILLAASAVAVKFTWRKNTVVVAVHHAQYRTDILVEHFPWTDSGKIAWWQENAGTLASNYHFQLPDKLNNQHVSIWQFGAGYMAEGKEDRMCFEDMPGPENCINKERIMSIKNGPKGEQEFLMPDEKYINRGDGEIRRVTEH